MMAMQYYAVSEKGTKRHTNEDCYSIEQKNDSVLFAIADGVGGLEKADMASTLAVNEVVNYFAGTNEPSVPTAFEQANKAVYNENQHLQLCMATTLLLCSINNTTRECIIAHVGDSRAYLFGTTTWKTKDHSMVQELVELGIITQQAAFVHPEKHRLKQAVGITPYVQHDIYETLLEEKSVVVLCTDGITDVVPDKDIENIARYNTPKNACDLLVKQTRDNGGKDDSTLIVIHV